MTLVGRTLQELVDKQLNTRPSKSAMTRYKEAGGHDEPNPLERLRFFCSLAMSGQDWLDSESLFDDLSKTKDFDFAIEDRAAGRILVWRNGSCRPATAEECVMWDALVNQMSGSREL